MSDKKIEYVDPSQLVFDPENPRLPEDKETVDRTSQQSILQYIEKEYAIDELGQSMADNGFFEEEPVLVVAEGKSGKLRVVEGNRRLAALKLLLDPAARNLLPVRRRELWNQLASQSDAKRLKRVPAIRYVARKELLDYLGFRHISGVKEWKAEAKARFLWSLMKSEGLDFKTAGRRTGSTGPAVRRQVESYSVLRQAQKKKLSVERAERYFGFFYNAMQDPGIRGYLGLPEATNITKPKESPIAQTHIENLEQTLVWLFGEPGRKPVVGESREIRKLGKVLQNKSATKVLVERSDLSAALRIAGDDRDSIETALIEARLNLITANGEAFNWSKDKRVRDLATDVRRVLAEVLKNLKID